MAISETHAVDAPIREFLMWLGRSPRTYAEAMEAWASHCPRFTVWEDALLAGLVQIEAGPSADLACVSLTARGQSALGLRARNRSI